MLDRSRQFNEPGYSGFCCYCGAFVRSNEMAVIYKIETSGCDMCKRGGPEHNVKRVGKLAIGVVE